MSKGIPVSSPNPAVPNSYRGPKAELQPRRTAKQVLLSYFYWTYSRGSFHYDVMVTLILAFIFITPWVWDYGDKPSATAGLEHPMQVVSDGGHGLIVTVHAADVAIPAGASNSVVKQALRKAIE